MRANPAGECRVSTPIKIRAGQPTPTCSAAFLAALALILAALLAGCGSRMPVIVTAGPIGATPALALVVTAITNAPALPKPAAETPVAQPTPLRVTLAPVPIPGPLTEPAVLNRYPLEPGAVGECLAVGAGKVWIGRFDGRVEERSAVDGRLLAVFPVVTADPVRDLLFDGSHLWALTFDPDEAAVWISVLNPGGEIVAYFEVSDDLPERFGLTPGQVWTQNAVYDSRTLTPARAPMNTDATVFAADDQGRMWAGGVNACDECAAAVRLFQLSNPAQAEQGPEGSQEVRALAWAAGRMWALTALNRLDGYDLSAVDWREPVARVELDDLDAPAADLLFDGAALWLLAGPGREGGTLYRHDAVTGERVGALKVGEIGAPNARVPLELAFDGRDLWVLTALDLARVGLPWTQ